MFDRRFPPSWAERKLFARIQAKLSPDEEVLAAVGLMRGPRPGTETLLPIIGVFIDLAVAVLVFLGVMKARKHFILAATAGQAILFRSTWRGRPIECVSALDLSEVGEINDATGDSFIELSGERYWISVSGTRCIGSAESSEPIRPASGPPTDESTNARSPSTCR